MAETPITAFGKLEINYVVDGKAHDFNVYVAPFDTVTGAFTGPVTGAANLQNLSNAIVTALFNSFGNAQTVTFGDWIAYKRESDGTFIPYLSGTPTNSGTKAGAASPVFNTLQTTVVMRTQTNKIARFIVFGHAYTIITKLISTSGMAAYWSQWVAIFTANTAIVGRDGSTMKTFVSLSQDTNDKLRKEYGQV